MNLSTLLLIPVLLAGMQQGEEPAETPQVTPPPAENMEGVDLAPDAEERLPQVGILVVSENSIVAGKLQSSLAQFGGKVKLVEISPAEALAVRVHDAKVEALTPAEIKARERSKEFLNEALEHYYEGEFANALERLGRVSALTEEVELPTQDRIDLFLWRAAVFLALNDQRQARANARRALALDPAVKPDLAVFPPQVATLVDRLRPSMRTATLLVQDVPASAVIHVDGRQVESPLEVTRGVHTLIVTAPGFRRIKTVLKIRGDRSVSVPLAIEVPEAVAPEIAALVWSDARRTKTDALVALAERADVDVWLLGAVEEDETGTGQQVRTVVLDIPTGSVERTETMKWTVTNEFAVAEAAAGLLRRVPEFRRAASSGGPAAANWVYGARVAGLAGVRQRTLSDGAGDLLSLRFAGAGPHLDLWWQAPLWRVGLETAWITYEFSSVRVNHLDGSHVSVPGGRTIVARPYGGLYTELPFWPAATAGAGLALAGEWHDAEDVLSLAGQPTGALPGYYRVVPELWVQAEAAVPGDLVVVVGGAYSPIGYWRDIPRGTFGESARTGHSTAWRAGLTWTAARNFRVSADYRGDLRATQYDGVGTSGIRPGVENAALTQMFHGFTVAAAFGF